MSSNEKNQLNEGENIKSEMLGYYSKLVDVWVNFILYIYLFIFFDNEKKYVALKNLNATISS